MYGLPGQTLASMESTLRHVVELGPEYITLYRMRYKGTRMLPQAAMVTRAEVNAQYHLAYQLLESAGYLGSLGKNTFSRLPGDPGTSDYLTERVIHGTPYLGLGLGAQTLSPTVLAYNSGAADKSLRHYQHNLEEGKLPVQDVYHLSRAAAMGKMISVAFYFGEIHLSSFWKKFGLTLEEAFSREVDFLVSRGLMAYTPTTLRLTAAGEQVYNGVIALFYSGEVQAYLLETAGLSPEVAGFEPQAELPVMDWHLEG